LILADLARRNGFLFASRLEGGLLIGDRLIEFGQFLFGCRTNRPVSASRRASIWPRASAAAC
jgi:hypothetical protein